MDKKKEGDMMRRLLVSVLLLCVVFGVVAFGFNLKYLGSFDPPRENWAFEGVSVGGISGLTLTPEGSFYAISDDKGDNIDPPGVLYKMNIDIDMAGIHSVEVVSMLQLNTPEGKTYAGGSIDGEDVIWTTTGFIVCSERDQANNPWIRKFSHDGAFLKEFPVPEKFMPAFDNGNQNRGVRTNFSFEASAMTPDYATLYVMNEEALAQDGDLATPVFGTPVRLIEYDMTGTDPVEKAEYVYVTEPMFATPPEGKSGDNGVPGMIYVGHITSKFDLIVMERSYVSGAGNQIALFGVKFNEATNVIGIEGLVDPENAHTILVLEKTPILVISDDKGLTQVDFDPDNMEAISLGPQLANGHYTVILGSDNNFNPKYQRNVFVAFEMVP
jgi:hypothetical protein